MLVMMFPFSGEQGIVSAVARAARTPGVPPWTGLALPLRVLVATGRDPGGEFVVLRAGHTGPGRRRSGTGRAAIWRFRFWELDH